MKKFKKFLGAGLAGLLAFSATACTTPSGTSNGGTSEEEKNYDSVVELAVLEAGYGRVPYTKLAEAYMAKNPGVLVKLRFDHQINTNVEHEIINGTKLADVYCIRETIQIFNYALQGKVVNLNSMLDSTFGAGYAEADKPVKTNIDERAIEACSLDGACYAIPEYTSITGFVYNATLFEEYGWTIPTNNKEFKELCDKILEDTDGEVSPIGYCGGAADGYLYFAIDNWLYQYAGIENLDAIHKYDNAELFHPNSEVSVGKKLAHEALDEFYIDLDEGGYAKNGSMSLDHISVQESLVTGDVAMMVNGTWVETEMSDMLLDYPEVELGMFPVPELVDENGEVVHAPSYTTVEGKRVLDASYGAYYFVPTESDNVEGAIDFLKFINSDEGSVIYTKYSNAVRPLNYNLDSSTDDYKDMKMYGRTIIDIAHSCYLYTPIENSALALTGAMKLYPSVGYWCKLHLMSPAEYGIDAMIQRDYNYAVARINQG